MATNVNVFVSVFQKRTPLTTVPRSTQLCAPSRCPVHEVCWSQHASLHKYEELIHILFHAGTERHLLKKREMSFRSGSCTACGIRVSCASDTFQFVLSRSIRRTETRFLNCVETYHTQRNTLRAETCSDTRRGSRISSCWKCRHQQSVAAMAWPN